MATQLRVEYTGTNVGKIYFTDIRKRHQLGGAIEGDYLGGQDEYIIWGQTKILQETDDVIMSMASGVLKFFSTQASSTTFNHNGAPLTLTEGSYTSVNEVPRADLGDTGGTLFADATLTILAQDTWGPTTVPGATGYYYGNE